MSDPEKVSSGWRISWGGYAAPLLYLALVLGIATVWLLIGRDSQDRGLALATLLIAAACNLHLSLIGCFLVLRRMSLLGDAISHAVLPGIAIAFFFSGQAFGPPMLIGAMCLAVLTSFLTQTLHSWGGVSEDTSLGVVYTGLFALGVILIQAWGSNAHLDADCALYGQIEYAALEPARVLGTHGAMLLAVLLFVGLLWKELKLTSFDASLATSMGLSAGVVHYALMAMVAGSTVAAFESVGTILVVAMLIVPATAATLMAERLGKMLLWSAVFGVTSSTLGYLAAASLDTNVAGMIAVVAGVQLGIVVLVAPRQGVLSRLGRNLMLAVRISAEDVLARLYRWEESPAKSPADIRAALQETQDRAATSWLVRWLAERQLLQRGQVLAVAGGSWQLTPTGRDAARTIVRAHRLWESYLDKHFALPADHLHEPAERMEHFLDPELQAQLDTELAGRSTDPHGKQIPELPGK